MAGGGEQMTLQEKLSTLPLRRRKKIAKRTALLIAEEMTMREIRKARQITQVEMAKKLGVKQEQVSRIEKRTDLHISTLRRSIEAMGGELSLIAKFPDGPPVRLSGFGEIEA
jgi:DNA-binding XRE family transcriptional regulator